MAWDFTNEPEVETQLKWVDDFVRDEVELLDYVVTNPRDMRDPLRQELIPPLQEKVKAAGLWSAHLPPEYGGQGYGHLRLAQIEEILGRSRCAPTVFGCQSPDSGNAQILSRYGTPAQREQYLQPLLDGTLVSCFSATEPQSGADPTMYRTAAVLDGDEWVINGEKWFSSGLEYSAFAIVMAVTDPDASPHNRLSAILVPTSTPGIHVIRNVSVGSHDGAKHSYVRYSDVRVPADHLLGERGGAFIVMQTRMSHARLALATRALGKMKRALDLMCERAVSRHTKGELLGDHQMVQEHLAEAWIDYETFRLLVMRTAWKLDQTHDFNATRADIAAVKIMLPRVVHSLASRAAQLHGSLGVSYEMPFMEMLTEGVTHAVADGPTEVHRVTLAKLMTRNVVPSPGIFPTFHIPERQQRAEEKYAEVLRRHGRL